MKLRKLTIHNIASIGDATIDFNAAPLNNAALFLITGDTGAGKSIILDSICLALYGTTPRLNGTNMQGDVLEVDCTIKINDPRQLLRRGTGEGYVELDFAGSDGHEYHARWDVFRARNKPGAKLQPTKHLLRRLDDRYLLEKKEDIKKVMPLITGLAFEQFCRTTMLAQGEFTRFLNSNDKDKAAILEKITGVDIYSRIGRQIYIETNQAKTDYETADALLANISLLTDEQIAEMQTAVAELKLVVQQLRQRHDSSQALKNILGQLSQARSEADAAARLLPTLQADTQRLHGYHAAIVEQLAQLQLKVAKAQKALKDNKADIKNIDRQVQEQTAAVEAMGLPQLNNLRSELMTLLKLCKNVMPCAENLTQAQDNLKKKRENLAGGEALLASLREQLPQLVKAEKAAEASAAKAQADYEAQSDTVDKFAVKMRHKLTVGQECPVCRQRIVDALPSDQDLKRLVDILLENRNAAKKSYDEALRKRTELEGRIPGGEKYCSDLRAEIERDKSVENARKQLDDACAAVGIAPDSADLTAAVSAKRTSLDTELTSINEKLGKAQAANKLKEDLTKQLLNLQKEQVNLQKAATDAEADARKISDEADNQKEIIDRLTDELGVQPEAVNAVPLPARRTLTQCVNDLQLSINSWQQRKASAAESIERLQTQLAEMSEKHGFELDQLPTVPQLDAQIQEATEQTAQANARIGSITNALETDAKNRSRMQTLKDDRDAKYAKWQLYNSLNAMLGSANGDKFRQLALSYVLGDLVRHANSYLQSLTDRYTLKVQPGEFIITLEDAYQGYETRTAATLSGGESFMVSLALALALSDISSTLRVDVLFIDEGFGTLSGDALNRAIDTLRSLQRRAGRRVGIISHVAELRENIDTQIQVERAAGSSLATVSVV